MANLVSCNAVLASCPWPQALRLADAADAADLVTLNALMNAFGKGCEWRRALQLLLEMKNRHMKVDVFTYGTLIGTAISACAQWEKALLLLQEMRCVHISANGITLNAAVSACAGGVKWPLALELQSYGARDWTTRSFSLRIYILTYIYMIIYKKCTNVNITCIKR